MAGNIKGITIEFSGDTTKLDRSLKEIDKSTKQVDKELRNVDKALKFNPTSVDLWRQKQDLLKQKIGDTETKLKSLKEKQKSMDARGVDKNSAEYRKLQREIITTESKLKHFKGELVKLGSAKLTALGNQFKMVGGKIKAVGRSMTMYITGPLVAAGGVAAKKYAEVDKIMQLTNSTMGNTTEQAEMLNQAMKEAAASSTYGMKDAATATLNFARAGLDAEQAAAALAPAMALAAGEGGNLDTVSGGLVATINGFHGSFDEAGRYADAFANACNNSALDVNTLSHAMSVAAPIFSAAGYEIEDAALYMGIMANNGIEADKAANSLKTGIARLIKPTDEASDWMTELGISVTNADGTMKSSIEIQEELHDAFGALSSSEQIAAASAIFGKNQMAPWLALINTSSDDVNALAEALQNEGTAAQMQADMMSGFGGSIEKLKSGLDVLGTSFGEALAPTILTVAEYIQKLVDWFNALSPQTQSMIATIATIAAALGPVLLILGSILSAVGTVISFIGSAITFIGSIGPAVSGVIAVISGPIGWVIAAIAAIIAIGVLLWQNWDTIKAKALEIKDKVVKAWNDMVKKVRLTLTAFKNFTLMVWNLIKNKVTTVVSGIKNKVVTAFSNIRDRAKTIFEGVKNAITHPIETAKTIIGNIVDKIKGFFSNLNISAPHIPLPHFKIKPTGWKIGDLVKGKIPSLSVDWYAKGGIFNRPTVLTGVGEAGPEAVLPLNTLWQKLDAIADAQSGGIVINVNGGGDPYAIAQEVRRVLIEEVKRRKQAWQ